MVTLRKIKYFYRIFAIIVIISALYYVYQQNQKGKQRFLEKEYNGIIKEIIYDELNRGDPIVKIGDTVLNFASGELKIRDYIQVGDSIIKESGITKITVCRKDEDDIWQCIDFE